MSENARRTAPVRRSESARMYPIGTSSSSIPPPESPGNLGEAHLLDGRYLLGERLGEGSSGVAYRALHVGLKRSFAVKLLKAGSAESSHLDRFAREAEALGRLRHPNVVEVADFGRDPSGAPYLVMELLEGKSLAEICRKGPTPLPRALLWLDEIAQAIDAAHERKILHRDLKPDNVLIVAVGGDQQAKVLDFGLADLLGKPKERSEAGSPPESGWSETLSGPEDAGLTETGALLGTPHYVAPEVILGERPQRASDLYSFGVIAYELLAGQPPFLGTTAEVLRAHVDREPSVPTPAGSPLPDVVWHALRALLEKDPARRPASAGEALSTIRRATERESLRRWRVRERPRRALLAAGLTACLFLLGLVLPTPFLPAIDRWVEDLRAATAPSRAPDPRILLLSLDEASLGGGAPPLASRGDEVGTTLERVFAAGAKGLAIDLLLPASWSESEAFSTLILRHPSAITLAAFSRPDGQVVGRECIGGLTTVALGSQRAADLFGFVNLDEGTDGVTRFGRIRYRDRSGATRPSWAAKTAGTLPPSLRIDETRDGAFALDSRIAVSRFDRISWREVSNALDRRPGRFRDRLVLLGGDFDPSGDDVHRVPPGAGRRGSVSGLALQAMLVDTLAAGSPVAEPARIPFLVGSLVPFGALLAGCLFARRARLAPIVLLGGACTYLGASFPAFWWLGWQLPSTLPLALALIGSLLVLLVRRRLPPAPEVSR